MGQKRYEAKEEKKKKLRRSQRKKKEKVEEKNEAVKVCNFAIFIQFIEN